MKSTHNEETHVVKKHINNPQLHVMVQNGKHVIIALLGSG